MYAYLNFIRLLEKKNKNAVLLMLQILNYNNYNDKCNKNMCIFLLVQFLPAVSTQTFTLTKA